MTTLHVFTPLLSAVFQGLVEQDSSVTWGQQEETQVVCRKPNGNCPGIG